MKNIYKKNIYQKIYRCWVIILWQILAALQPLMQLCHVLTSCNIRSNSLKSKRECHRLVSVIFMTFPMNTKCLIKCRRRTQIAIFSRKVLEPGWMGDGSPTPIFRLFSACDDTHNLFNFHVSVCVRACAPS